MPGVVLQQLKAGWSWLKCVDWDAREVTSEFQGRLPHVSTHVENCHRMGLSHDPREINERVRYRENLC